MGISDALVIGGGRTGALVGESEKPITASWTTGAVRGGTQVGGLIGLSESDVTASYSLASVNATNKGGGLIGEQDGGAVTASYAGGEVTVSGTTKGGLVAAASNTPTDTDNHYNSDTTTQATSALGTARTDAALRTPTGYTGIYEDWDVDIDNTDADDDLTTGGDDPWHITAGNYPVLDYGTGASTTTQTNEQPAVPATPSIVRHNPADAVHTDLTPTFRVSSLTEDAVITLHTDSACVNAALTTTPMTPTVAAGDTNKDIDSTFVIGSHTVYAKQTLNNVPSACSSAVSFEIKGTPAAPSGLTAAVGDAEITVSWTDPSNPTITKYQYKQKVGAADYDVSWTDIASSSTITSHTFESLTNGTAYRYKIRAVNAAGNGAEGETASATPVSFASAAPANITLAQEAGGIAPYTGTGTHRTRDTTPTISFTAVSGATTEVEYKEGSGGTFTTTGITPHRHRSRHIPPPRSSPQSAPTKPTMCESRKMKTA